MDSTTLRTENKGNQIGTGGQVQSLYQVCQHLKDGRKARGKHSDLAGVLVVTILAKLAGMSSVLAASEWAKDQEEVIRAHVKLSWRRMPCANTYSSVLARLDSQQVNAQLAAWFVRQFHQQGEANEQHTHLAIDGKALKSTGEQAYGGEHPQQHLLHIYEAETGAVLHQISIGTKTNEVGALKPLLTEAMCKGRVMTADAAQSSHDITRLAKRAGGDVILIIKNNTPLTRADLELFFEDEQADRSSWQSYTPVEKGHGRLERRSLLRSPDLGGLFWHRTGARLGRSFASNANEPSKGNRVARFATGSPRFLPSNVLRSVCCTICEPTGRWRIISTGSVMRLWARIAAAFASFQPWKCWRCSIRWFFRSCTSTGFPPSLASFVGFPPILMRRLLGCFKTFEKPWLDFCQILHFAKNQGII
ncbi:MAG TPA: ISAs1 family transposase [Ktedonobacteraceae bacterium]|nr:ISAs1 family transposase [Ktedonobacteraceae bacterium]